MVLNKCVWLAFHFETTHFSKYNLLHQFLTFSPQIISHLIRSHISMCALVKENIFLILIPLKIQSGPCAQEIHNAGSIFWLHYSIVSRCEGNDTFLQKNQNTFLDYFFFNNFLGKICTRQVFLSQPQKMP